MKLKKHMSQHEQVGECSKGSLNHDLQLKDEKMKEELGKCEKKYLNHQLN